MRAPYVLLFLAGCGGADSELSIRWADEATRDAATSLSVLIFEPLVQADNGDIELLSCDRVGSFPAARRLDPEELRLGGGLGRLLKDRRSQDYPLDEDLDLEFTAVPEGDQSNPWGLAMILVQARASVRSAEPEGGAPIATIASACTCIAMRDARGRNANLDAEVQAACPTLEEEPNRELALKSVLPVGFDLQPCYEACATVSPESAIGGAPACVVETRCGNGKTTDCFDCDELDCSEVGDYSNVPVLFTAGGETELLLTGKDGRAQTRLRPATCTEDQSISARVLGTAEPAFETPLACVPALQNFECTDIQLQPNLGELVALDALPGSGVAMLFDYAAGARLVAIDPRAPSQAQLIELPVRQAQGLSAYFYQPATETRPLIAVATTTSSNLAQQVRVDLYDWTEPVGEAGRYAAFCDADGCAREACSLGARSDEHASIGAADLDHDGKNDLVMMGDSGTSVVVGLRSGEASGGALYEQTSCTCGQYAGTTSSEMHVADFGGVLGGTIDVFLATTYGPQIAFGDVDRSLPDCASRVPIAMSSVVRDISAGELGCDPNGPAERACGRCGRGKDAVIAGGSFASGNTSGVQIVLSRDTNADVSDRLTSTVKLDAASSAGDDPTQVEPGDFNGDGFDDLAFLYGETGEVNVWLGARNGALSRSSVVVPAARCPFAKMVTADVDRDGIAEIFLACNREGTEVLRRCVPVPVQPR